ncbi:hypothetical protein JTB14_013984 [Gonioctena quinquepunctata]|nr:hypothetical protein JTB14_013984 [Gonioctena quinquepunctata]
MMGNVGPHVKENLEAGFRKCGIFPLNSEEVSNRLPRSSCDQQVVQSPFLKVLENKRYEQEKVSALMILMKTTLTILDDIDIDEIQKDNEGEQFLDFVEGKASAEDEFCFKGVVRKAGSFVVFSYENELYPGEIVAFDNDYQRNADIP